MELPGAGSGAQNPKMQAVWNCCHALQKFVWFGGFRLKGVENIQFLMKTSSTV
jgi:hypothetical protein